MNINKGFISTAMVLWALVLIAIIGITISTATGRVSNMIRISELIKSQKISSYEVRKVLVEGTYQSIEIRKTQSEDIGVYQYGSASTNENRLFLSSVSDGVVHIYFSTDLRIGIFSITREKLVIEIPHNYSGHLDVETSSGGIRTFDELKLDEVILHASSGGILLNGSLTAETITVETSSGGIKSEGELSARALSAQASSGGIHLMAPVNVVQEAILKTSSGGIKSDDTITASRLEAKTASGGIQLSNVSVEQYSLNSSSGSIKADGISGGGEVNATSGGINMSLVNPHGNIVLKTTSGGIKLLLEQQLHFTMQADTKSGGIKTNFPTTKNQRGNSASATIGDNPIVHINASATSGGIRIEM